VEIPPAEPAGDRQQDNDEEQFSQGSG
jgi:hypothetical protein